MYCQRAARNSGYGMGVSYDGRFSAVSRGHSPECSPCAFAISTFCTPFNIFNLNPRMARQRTLRIAHSLGKKNWSTPPTVRSLERELPSTGNRVEIQLPSRRRCCAIPGLENLPYISNSNHLRTLRVFPGSQNGFARRGNPIPSASR